MSPSSNVNRQLPEPLPAGRPGLCHVPICTASSVVVWQASITIRISGSGHCQTSTCYLPWTLSAVTCVRDRALGCHAADRRAPDAAGSRTSASLWFEFRVSFWNSSHYELHAPARPGQPRWSHHRKASWNLYVPGVAGWAQSVLADALPMGGIRCPVTEGGTSTAVSGRCRRPGSSVSVE